jgi:hypothetical protein
VKHDPATLFMRDQLKRIFPTVPGIGEFFDRQLAAVLDPAMGEKRKEVNDEEDAARPPQGDA